MYGAERARAAPSVATSAGDVEVDAPRHSCCGSLVRMLPRRGAGRAARRSGEPVAPTYGRRDVELRVVEHDLPARRAHREVPADRALRDRVPAFLDRDQPAADGVAVD